MQTRVYLPLEQILCTTHAIFSQQPRDLKEELRNALEGYPELRRPHLDRHALEHGPSVFRYWAQDVVQELKDKVTCCRR